MNKEDVLEKIEECIETLEVIRNDVDKYEEDDFELVYNKLGSINEQLLQV